MPDSQHSDSKRGRAVQVVSILANNTLKLDEVALHGVLHDDRVKDLPVVVVSVAGKFRQGKSFLLGFFLRYLQAEGASSWLDDQEAVIKGFDWKGGQTKVTSGIYIWSEPFVVQTATQGKVAVVLMDTQGTDDTNAGDITEVPIFALSTMLSSVLVFNVIKLARSDLVSLQLFMDYGILASKKDESSKKPFQKLQFLIRDWNSANLHPFGGEGGPDYVNNLQKTQGGESLVLDDAFDEVKCFLLPHPGKLVDNDKYQGLVKDADSDFLEHLRQFVETLLAPEKLVVKTSFAGTPLTGPGWCELFRDSVGFFVSGKCPPPKKLYEVTRVHCYEEALVAAKNYLNTETKVFKKKVVENLEEKLKPINAETRRVYNEIPKMGKNRRNDVKYNTLLEEIIAKKKKSLVKLNKQYQIIEELQQYKAKWFQRNKSEKKLGKSKENAEEEIKKLSEKQKKVMQEEDKKASDRKKEAVISEDVSKVDGVLGGMKSMSQGGKLIRTGSEVSGVISGIAATSGAGAAIGAAVVVIPVLGGAGLIAAGAIQIGRGIWNRFRN